MSFAVENNTFRAFHLNFITVLVEPLNFLPPFESGFYSEPSRAKSCLDFFFIERLCASKLTVRFQQIPEFSFLLPFLISVSINIDLEPYTDLKESKISWSFSMVSSQFQILSWFHQQFMNCSFARKILVKLIHCEIIIFQPDCKMTFAGDNWAQISQRMLCRKYCKKSFWFQNEFFVDDDL